MTYEYVQLTSVDDMILEVQFSPYEWSADCLAILTSSKLVIGKFEEDNDKFKFVLLHIVPLTEPTAFAWSPQTKSDFLPMHFKIAVGDKKGVISVFSYDENSLLEHKELYRAPESIDCLAFCPTNGDLLAATADRCCYLITEEDIDSISLTSSCRRIAWHPSAEFHLLLAELCGRIRIIDVQEKEIRGNVLTLENFVRHAPLFDADWASGGQSANGMTSRLSVLTAQSGGTTITLDALSNNQLEIPCLLPERSKCLRWCPSNGELLATIHGKVSHLKIINTKINAIFSSDEPLDHCQNLSWHLRRPMLLASRYYNVFLVLVD